MSRIAKLLPCLIVVIAIAGACADQASGPSASAPPSATLATTSPAPSVSQAAATQAASLGPTDSSASAGPTADGQIVFENFPNAANRAQIWIERADGSGARRLVESTLYDDSPTISPDGRTVLFHRMDPDLSPGAMLADPTLADKTMIVNVDGTGLHEIHTTPRAKGCFDAVEGDAWSPDGTHFAVSRVCFDAAQKVVRFGIWTVKADGSGAREVTSDIPPGHIEDHRAGWSPDGTRLVFARLDTSVSPERSAIFTVDTDGSHVHQVTQWALDANDPVWSPDGTLIAFNSPAEANQGGPQNIYTIHPDGTGLTQLTKDLSAFPDGEQGTFHPSWSPDGAQIVFTHDPGTGGPGDLYVMNRDGTGLRVLAETALAEEHTDWGKSPSP